MERMHCPWEQVDYDIYHCSIDREQARIWLKYSMTFNHHAFSEHALYRVCAWHKSSVHLVHACRHCAVRHQMLANICKTDIADKTPLQLTATYTYSHACEAYDCATGTERCDILVPIAALMLHAYPQLVHLCEIDQQEVNSVCDVTASAFILRPHIWQKASGDLHRALTCPR